MANTDRMPAQRIWGVFSLGVLAALLSAWSAFAQSAATPPIIAEVRIVGNVNIPADQIMRYIRAKKGEYYSADVVKEDIRRLQESRLPNKVFSREERSADGQIILIYEIRENRGIIRDIVFKHANHISDKELDNIARLKKGMPMSPVWNQQVAYELQDFLKKQGRYFASVQIEEGLKDTDTRVVFNITEGPVVRVRSVTFKGQDQLATADRLKTQVDTSRHYVNFGGKFNSAMIDNDVQKLREYYESNGYLNARVTRELIFTNELNEVDVVFYIHEGERFRVDYVKAEGLKSVSAEETQKFLTTKPGQFYNKKDTATDVRYIQDYVGYRGRKVDVQEVRFSVPEQPGLVRVQYLVKEVDTVPSRVGTVTVVGNDITRADVVRRYLGNILPGQTISYPDLRIAEANLARSGLFAANPETGERPTIEVIDNPNSAFKDLLVRVKETTTGSIMLGAGVSSDAGLVGQAVINEKNFDIFNWPTSWEELYTLRAFRGGGQEFRIEAAPGTQVQRYVVSFREPFLFDRPYSLGVSGYYYDRIFNEYTENRYGGRFTLGHQVNNQVTVNAGIRLENVGVDNIGDFAPQDYKDVLGTNFLAVPRLGMSYDTRDSFMRPTEGLFVDGAGEYGMGDFNFPILTAEASHFYSVFQRADGSGKHVIAMKHQIGWAGDSTPVFERFYGGGFRSVRGFQFRGLGPNDNGYMVGGNFMFMNSIEYQIPLKANDNLYVVGFIDSGTVERDVSIRDYRVSAGVGLRIVVPMMGPVPIALDFGFPIVRGETDREQIFAFYVGFAR